MLIGHLVPGVEFEHFVTVHIENYGGEGRRHVRYHKSAINFSGANGALSLLPWSEPFLVLLCTCGGGALGAPVYMPGGDSVVV